MTRQNTNYTKFTLRDTWLVSYLETLFIYGNKFCSHSQGLKKLLRRSAFNIKFFESLLT